MTRELAVYLVAVVLVSLGMYVHVVLFNLYLADLSFREDLMGRLASAMTLGTALGTIPAAALARRLGLRSTMLISLLGLALSLAQRALLEGAALALVSLLAGFFLAGWFVTNPPAVAALSGTVGGVDVQRSAPAFSLNIAVAIGVGAAGGLLAGRLPGWLGGASPAAAKRAALLVAAGLVASAMVIVSRVRFPDGPRPAASPVGAGIGNPQSVLLRPSPARAFLLRFLLAVSLWYAFGAGFLPFFNVYLRNRMGASLETIGGVFAAAQVAQALAALLMAPLIARLGMLPAVVGTQLLAAACLLALWPVHTLGAAAILYLAYLSFQVMSEPGLQTLLMARVPAAERPAAWAANLLLMFGIQALVGAVAGALIVARGYGALFVALGVTGLAAAALFGALFARALPPETVPDSSAARSSPWRRE